MILDAYPAGRDDDPDAAPAGLLRTGQHGGGSCRPIQAPGNVGGQAQDGLDTAG